MKEKIKVPQSGASRFDFAITISIIAILAYVLLFSLNHAQSQVETVTMETDLTNMRWGLRELWAHRNARGQSIAGSEIDDSNPLRLLNDHPEHYIGEYADIPPGSQSSWYFDTKAKRLVYVFSDGQQLRYRLTSAAQLNRASLGAMGGIDLLLE